MLQNRLISTLTSQRSRRKPGLFLKSWTQITYFHIMMMQKRFDFLDVKEVKIWTPGGQNGKPMPFLKSLTQKNICFNIHDVKRSDFIFGLSDVMDVKVWPLGG